MQSATCTNHMGSVGVLISHKSFQHFRWANSCFWWPLCFFVCAKLWWMLRVEVPSYSYIPAFDRIYSLASNCLLTALPLDSVASSVLPLRLLGPCTVKGCPSLPRTWRKTGRSSLLVLLLLLLLVVVVVVVVVAGGGGGGGGGFNAWLLQENGSGDTLYRSVKSTAIYFFWCPEPHTTSECWVFPLWVESLFAECSGSDDFGWRISTKPPPTNELDSSWWPS